MASRNGIRASIDSGDSSEVVSVGRDPDDDRRVRVALGDLRNPHWADRCGGRREPLPTPQLAAYMDSSLIPPGVAFGFGGAHGDGSIKVLVQDDTHPKVLERLRELAERPKCNARMRGRLEDRGVLIGEES